MRAPQGYLKCISIHIEHKTTIIGLSCLWFVKMLAVIIRCQRLSPTYYTHTAVHHATEQVNKPKHAGKGLLYS